MASLQARHQRDCAIVVARRVTKERAGDSGPVSQWTTFAEANKTSGCTCTPLYHVALRHEGKLIREPVGHNRKEAERALDARRGDVARRTYRVLQDVRFDEWADRWLADFTGKANSARVYGFTMNYAKAAIGKKKVRDIEPADVRRFLSKIREEHAGRAKPAKEGEEEQPARIVSDATLLKHLRILGACLQAAVVEGYASENPVRRLHTTHRPKPVKRRPAYYTDEELARLWPALAARPVFVAFCKIAVTTGMRFGELAALRWSDVSLVDREIHVSRAYTTGVGETTPKSNEPRVVDLTPAAVAVLEGWYADSRTAGGDELVFERETGGHVDAAYMTRHVLYPALKAAGIARMGERGRNRDFHSFRHTFARIALENGAQIAWVQKQLGHSSITLTVDTYGSWARAAEKSQAEKLAGAFAV